MSPVVCSVITEQKVDVLGRGSTEKEASGPVGGEERSCLHVGQSCGLQRRVFKWFKT